MSKIIAFGELLWDVLPSGPVLGGAPANFCFRATTLGLKAKLVSRVGNDNFGEIAIKELGKRGVDTSLVQIDEKLPTGTVQVEFDEKRNANYNILRDVAYDNISVTDELLKDCEDATILCFGSLVLRSQGNQKTLSTLLSAAKSATKICDINLRKDCYTPETLKFCLLNADILKLNDQEALKLIEIFNLPYKTYQDFARSSIEMYQLKTCLVTRAENGVFACKSDGTEIDLPGNAVEVQDTIGSGDAFTAGFTAKFESKASLEECCEFGNSLGAAVATTKGGMSQVDPDFVVKYKVIK